MADEYINKKNLTLSIKTIFLSISVFWLIANGATAQTLNPVILTWQADNFYPANYPGRDLPSFGTPIKVAAEILKDSKLIDVSQMTFMWYVDGNLVNRGEGLKEISFGAQKAAGDYHFVRAVIQTPDGNSFANSIQIYIQAPTVILEGAFPDQNVPAGGQVTLRAIPYFFNIKSLNNLKFSWSINSQEQTSGSDNELSLKLDALSAGNLLQLMAVAQNSINPLESAIARLNLNIR